MMSGGQSSMRSAGSFDPRCLGYGIQWGMRLTLLFADTLFVGRANRGADSFCDALMLATIAVYAVMFLLCRKRDESQPLTSRFLNRSCLAQVALIVCGLVLIVLASFVEQFQVASIAAGICLGCGMGLAVYEWVYLFMRRGAMAARQSLVASWLLGVGIFALLALVPSLLRLILLCVLGIASVALELGYARTTHGLDASESGASQDSTLERRAGADGHGTTRELRQFAPIAVAATVLGFAYGMSGPLQLSGGGASTGDAALLANHVGTALIAALVASLILFASVGRLNLLPVFLAAFTLDTTAAIALPFAGDGYFPLCASIFGMVNRVAGMLVLLFVCHASQSAHLLSSGTVFAWRIEPGAHGRRSHRQRAVCQHCQRVCGAYGGHAGHHVRHVRGAHRCACHTRMARRANCQRHHACL